MARNWNGFGWLFALAFLLVAGFSSAVFAANSTWQDSASAATAAEYWSPGAACGWYGISCCANQTCYAGLNCNNGTCLLNLPPETENSFCGKPGQLCCGGTTCYAGAVCGGGLCQLRDYYNGTVCGWLGGNCCGGGVCYTGTSCTANGVCLPNAAAPSAAAMNNSTAATCGSAGKACCSGNTCQPGYECRSGTCQKSASAQPSGKKITLYTSAQPSSYGQAYPSLATGAYGAKVSITARPFSGYDFDEWSGDCPISDIYEKYALVTLSTGQSACRITAIFSKTEAQCGSAGKQCCAGSSCNAGLVCSSNVCQAAQPVNAANATPPAKPPVAANEATDSGGSKKPQVLAPASACGDEGQACCAGKICHGDVLCDSKNVCKKPEAKNAAAATVNAGTVANNTTATPASAAPAADNGTVSKCALGQNNCQCGYGPRCGASNYCDTSSQNCFPECQQGITTGNCICRANAAAPYMIWWGTCGTAAAQMANNSTAPAPANPANNSTAPTPTAAPSANNSTPQQCTTGQTGCKCGYGAVCGAGTYCDTTAQNCFPECQQGVTTGNCMCRTSGAAPYVLWWGVCGTPAAPVCGAVNQTCCNGITCNTGLGCVSGKCAPKCAMGQADCPCGYGAPCSGGTYCDTSSQLCLPACQYGIMSAGCMCLPQGGSGTPHVNWWGICGTMPCGAANQTCCAGNACNSGYACQYGTCRVPPVNVTCGGANQPCCTTGTACTASGHTCQSGTCRAYVPPNNTGCGGAGQLCCGGAACNAGMTCGGGLCQYSQYFNNSVCGWYGVDCCGGGVCYTGYQCDHGTCLIQLPPETADSTCGKAGQLCCGGTTCYSNLVCGGGLCQWREYYNSTICGWWGGQCCGGNVCYTGTSCTNGICLPVATSNNTTVCGGNGQLCCPGDTCNSGYTCQLGTCGVYVPPVNNSTQIITLYTESMPGGSGRTYPITTTGVYGHIKDIEAVPEAGYDFAEWTGNCPISDIYERVTTITLTPGSGTYCRAIANFPAGGVTCGASGKPCCSGNACNAGLACNAIGTCVPASNVTLLPDFVIMDIDIPAVVQVGVRAYGNIRTTNVGNTPAQNSTMSYYINGLMVNSVEVPQLPASGANIAIASFICQHSGTYAFMARADSTSAIVERNETNNELETTFICVN